MNKNKSKKIHKQSSDDLKKDFNFGKKPEEKAAPKKFGRGTYGK